MRDKYIMFSMQDNDAQQSDDDNFEYDDDESIDCSPCKQLFVVLQNKIYIFIDLSS